MRDPVQSRSGGSSAGGKNNSGKKSKDNYCWTFNKNRCNNGQSCQFEHRCLYCDGWAQACLTALSCRREGESMITDMEKEEMVVAPRSIINTKRKIVISVFNTNYVVLC